MSKLIVSTSKSGEMPREIHSVKAEASDPEKSMLEIILDEAEPLPYALKAIEMYDGSTEQEYEIPDEDKQSVLDTLYPFDKCPKLNERRFDIHEQKVFTVREYRVIRCRNRNMIVSPYYNHSGGMVVDWMPTEEDNDFIQVVKSSK